MLQTKPLMRLYMIPIHNYLKVGDPLFVGDEIWDQWAWVSARKHKHPRRCKKGMRIRRITRTTIQRQDLSTYSEPKPLHWQGAKLKSK